MHEAQNIVQRYKNRGNVLSHAKDVIRLYEWQMSLNITGWRYRLEKKCPEDVCLYLDEHIPQWREKMTRSQVFNQKAMMFAEGIVARFEARGNVMPVRSKECKADPSRAQEYRDAAKLNDWKQSLKGNKTKTVCCEEVRAYLDAKVSQCIADLREVTAHPSSLIV
jgi:hypothetical protein